MNDLASEIYYVRNSFKSTSLKTAESFDIHIPGQDEPYLICREPDIGTMTKVSRFVGGSHDMSSPFDMVITEGAGGERQFRLKRYSRFIGGPQIDFYDETDQVIGTMKRHVFSIGANYKFLGETKDSTFVIKFKSRMNGYGFKVDGQDVGSVHFRWKKEYPGSVKERFSHSIRLSDSLEKGSLRRALVFSIGIAIHKLRY